jgi:small subunit ribosomal protein S17
MPNDRKRLIGRVVSDKMDKTVVVAIDRRKMHRVYKKVINFTKKVNAHDESNEVELGSLVQVVESKPLSKTKRWVVEKVLEGPGGRVLEPVVGVVEVTAEAVAAGGEEEAEVAAPVAEVAAEVEAPAAEEAVEADAEVVDEAASPETDAPVDDEETTS